MLKNSDQIGVAQALHNNGRIVAYHDDNHASVYVLEFEKEHKARAFLPVSRENFDYMKRNGYLEMRTIHYTNSLKYPTQEEYKISLTGTHKYEVHKYEEIETPFSIIQSDEGENSVSRRRRKRKKRGKNKRNKRTETYSKASGTHTRTKASGTHTRTYDYTRGSYARYSRWSGFGHVRGPEKVEAGIIRKKIRKKQEFNL